MVKQLTTVEVVQDEVKFIGTLEGKMESDKEGAFDLLQNSLFDKGVESVLVRLYLRFLEDFHGEGFLGLFAFY